MKHNIHLRLLTGTLAAAVVWTAAAQQGDLNGVERASRVLGKEVRASGGSKLGTIDNLVVDLESGRVLYAVVDTGKDKVALPPGVFTNPRGDEVTISATEDKLKDAPQFTRETGSASEINKASFVSRVYRNFGQTEWWKGSRPSDEGTFNNVHRLTDLRGARIVNVQDQPMGKISNLAVDLQAGRVLYALMSPDDSLGVSEGLYPIPPNILTPNKKYDTTTFSAELNKEKLTSGPRLTRNDWSRLSNESWAAGVYSHYGKQPYFTGAGALTPTGRDSNAARSSDGVDNTRNSNDQVISGEQSTRERQRAADRERQRSGWNRGKVTDRPSPSNRNDSVISRSRSNSGETRQTETTPSKNSTADDEWERDLQRNRTSSSSSR